MKIAIVGAGAMGSLFGALLAEAGNSVTLLDLRADHVNAILGKGLFIEREGKARRVSLHATTDPSAVEPAELVILFVKSTATRSAAQAALPLATSAGLVLTLQNGMGNAEQIAQIVSPGRVIAGTTAHGATLLGPGKIRHAGTGPTVIGMLEGNRTQRLDQVAAVFTQAGISADSVDDIRPVIWEKLLVNVGINAITALTGIRNGQILDLTATREISQMAVEEAAGVARAAGIRVREDITAHVLAIATATSANRSSMGQDVDNGRLTEIEAINGAVVREATRMGMAVPVNRTLTGLIETLQRNYAPSDKNG